MAASHVWHTVVRDNTVGEDPQQSYQALEGGWIFNSTESMTCKHLVRNNPTAQRWLVANSGSVHESRVTSSDFRDMLLRRWGVAPEGAYTLGCSDGNQTQIPRYPFSGGWTSKSTRILQTNTYNISYILFILLFFFKLKLCVLCQVSSK